MNKLFLAIMLFYIMTFSCMAATTSQPVAPSGNLYINSKFHCSIQGRNEWQIDTTTPGQLVIFKYMDGVTSVALRAFDMTVAPTANGLANMMATSAYDGWVNDGGRAGDEDDVFVTGADEKYEAIYRKPNMDDQGKVETTIVAEAYYVKGKTAFIITGKTSNVFFPAVKTDLRAIMQSFYIDESL